jgi:hypothetical protein
VPFGEHAAGFAFTSGRFDHSSELPEDANAGNRFYGRDVAEFIAGGLNQRGLDASFLDEDWGWQVHARRPDDSILEVSVYNNIDEDPARGDDWELMVRVLRKEKLLGLVSRNREVELDAGAAAALQEVFRQDGIDLRRTARF